MGFFRGMVILAIGVFAGMHIGKHYSIETVEERKRILTEMREFAEQYKKPHPFSPPTGGVTAPPVAVKDSTLTGRDEILKDLPSPASQ